MFAPIALAALIASPSPAAAASPATIAAELDNVSLGQPISSLRDRYGDPVAIQEVPSRSQRIWRFLENGNRFLDVMEHDGVAVSVTVAKYGSEATFTDQRGIAFGMASSDVTKVLGQPHSASRNADDGSVDLWYRGPDAVLIYEFLGDRLVFEQLLAPRERQGGYAPAASVEPHGGTSTADAIVVSAPSSDWIHAYFALNVCDANGRWQTVSSHAIEKGSTYQFVHATCSNGQLSRDFYFQLPPAGSSA